MVFCEGAFCDGLSDGLRNISYKLAEVLVTKNIT